MLGFSIRFLGEISSNRGECYLKVSHCHESQYLPKGQFTQLDSS